MPSDKPRSIESLGTGRDDGLEALTPLDVANTNSVDALLRAMSQTAFGGRRLGEAADVLEAMIRDSDCLVVVTLSGAMTIAKQGLVLCEMIDRGWVHAIVSTGALMTHGLVEGAGMQHFKHRSNMDDHELFKKGYNRVYDTIELEKNLNDTEKVLKRALADVSDDTVLSSADVCERIGRDLEQNAPGRAILKSAVQRGVPVYVPAFTDSELGLDFALQSRERVRDGRAPLRFDPFRDLEDFTARIAASERHGIFTIGGGVPRNWAQQVAPYLEILNTRLGENLPLRRYRYGVRICPEPEHWGGLSGCGYQEGISWGKFVPESEGGRYAEVHADATIAWPLLVRAVLERLEAG